MQRGGIFGARAGYRGPWSRRKQKNGPLPPSLPPPPDGTITVRLLPRFRAGGGTSVPSPRALAESAKQGAGRLKLKSATDCGKPAHSHSKTGAVARAISFLAGWPTEIRPSRPSFLPGCRTPNAHLLPSWSNSRALDRPFRQQHEKFPCAHWHRRQKSSRPRRSANYHWAGQPHGRLSQGHTNPAQQSHRPRNSTTSEAARPFDGLQVRRIFASPWLDVKPFPRFSIPSLRRS